jgi:flagellar basal body-associated protein FliL
MRGKTLIIVIASVGVVLLLGAGGAYWMLGRHAKAHPVAKAAPKPLFVSLDPMTVSVHGQNRFGLQSDGAYLQVGFQFATVKKEAVNEFNAILPAVRGNVLSLLLNVSPKVLTEQAAREKMKQQVLAEVNKTLAKNDSSLAKQAFGKAYITLFVTQPE